MAKKTKDEKDQEIIKKARECLEGHNSREDDNIRRAKDAIRFRALEQWPDKVKQVREDPHQEGGPRPCPVMDNVGQYVRQVVNEERLNRAAIEVSPVDNFADNRVADVFTGMIRSIEDASDATGVYCSAGEQAIDGGFGYFRLINEYVNPKSFDQHIRVKRIPNRFAVAMGYHQDPTGKDAPDALVYEDIALDEFKIKYPNAETEGFDAKDDWASEDTIRVAEYICKKFTPTKIHKLSTGEVKWDDELEAIPEEVEIVNSRDTLRVSIKWYKLTGVEILEETDLPGQYLPIIKSTGEEIILPDGKRRLAGMVEPMMEPQRVHNYAWAGFIEEVALAPRAPIIAETGQIDGYEHEYKMSNKANIAVLPYNLVVDDEGRQVPPPQRSMPAGVSAGWQNVMMGTKTAIENAAGMFGPSVGRESQERSGIALREQKEQGMIGNYHFPDNLSKAIAQCGKVLLEWIPVFYDTERIVKILGEDGVSDEAQINPQQEMPVMEMVDQVSGDVTGLSYNLTLGEYDVTVSTGPSYTAKRHEAADFQMQLVNANPDLMNIIGDILFKNIDQPGSDDIAKRLKALLPPEIRQLEAQDMQIPPEMQEIVRQVEAQAAELEQRAAELQAAEADLMARAQEQNADKVAIDAERKVLAAEKKVLAAETKAFVLEIESKADELSGAIEEQLGVDKDLLLKASDEHVRLEDINAKKAMHDREMDLKEKQAGEQPQDYAKTTSSAVVEGINEVVKGFAGKLGDIENEIKRPKEIEYDEGGNPISVGGRKVVTDEKGNPTGLE